MTTDVRKLCVMCAWRGTCQIKYSMPGGVATHCVEYTRDITLREPEEEVRKRNILLVGAGEIGKTTLVKRLLESGGVRAAGYYSQRVKEGFFGSATQLFLLQPGKPREIPLASSKAKDGWTRMGRQHVNLEAVNGMVVPVLREALKSKDTDVIILDEVGKSECLSEAFRQVVVDCITSHKSVLATVSVGEGDDDFLKGLESRVDVSVLHMGYDNRDSLVDQVRFMLQGEKAKF